MHPDSTPSVALDDTIAAIATATGAAGLAVVRVSGPAAVAVIDAVFRGRAALVGAASHTLHHGWAVEPSGARIDEVVAALFRAPRSYTREDVVELSCHGGALPAGRILAALVAAGARPARAGEFTLRAFLNGRLDLVQAEAVADVIHAETEAARALAVSQLAGALSREVRAIAESVLDTLAEVEARVDFAEDVGGVEVPDHALCALEACSARLAVMLEGAAYARALREGVRVPLVGRPNVGKSSLFNALLGEERAIVTAHPGTTRDRVSEAIEIAGIRVTLTDTAGLRDTREPVEAIGVARAAEALESSPLAIWVVDGSAAWTEEDAQVAERLAGKRVLVALNKRDLGVGVAAREGVARALTTAAEHIVEVSASRGEGVADLRDALGAMLGGGSGGPVSRSTSGGAMNVGAGRAAVANGGAAEARATKGGSERTTVAYADVTDDDETNGRATSGATPGGAMKPGATRTAEVLGVVAANPRHADALERARGALRRAIDGGRGGEPGEIVSLELREALTALGEVTGETVDADLLDRIFSRFCIGK